MKTKHMSALLRDDITTVACYIQRDVERREGAQGVNRYTFKVLKTDAEKMKDGTLLVVDTKNGMTVASVAEVHAEPQIDPDFEGDYRWVVQVIDMDRHMAVIQHEREMDKVILDSEREIKRKSVVEQYRETLKGTPLGKQFAKLLHGPALPAPTTKTVKR